MSVATADALTAVAALSELVGKTVELTEGPGTGVILDASRPRDLFNRFWLIVSYTVVGDKVVLTLQNPTMVDPGLQNVTPPDGTTKFAITNLSINFFADEKEQVDYTFVYDNDSVANGSGARTSATGNVLNYNAGGSADSLVVETQDLLAIGLTGNNLNLLLGRTLEITVGAGLFRVWTITGIADGAAGTKVL